MAAANVNLSSANTPSATPPVAAKSKSPFIIVPAPTWKWENGVYIPYFNNSATTASAAGAALNQTLATTNAGGAAASTGSFGNAPSKQVSAMMLEGVQKEVMQKRQMIEFDASFDARKQSRFLPTICNALKLPVLVDLCKHAGTGWVINFSGSVKEHGIVDGHKRTISFYADVTEKDFLTQFVMAMVEVGFMTDPQYTALDDDMDLAFDRLYAFQIVMDAGKKAYGWNQKFDVTTTYKHH